MIPLQNVDHFDDILTERIMAESLSFFAPHMSPDHHFLSLGYMFRGRLRSEMNYYNMCLATD